MKQKLILFIVISFFAATFQQATASAKNDQKYPVGKPGLEITYISTLDDLPTSNVKKLTLTTGPTEVIAQVTYQWLKLNAEKGNGEVFSVWTLASAFPSSSLKEAEKEIARYILKKGNSVPLEFTSETTGGAVLPNTGAWPYLLPRSEGDNNIFNSKVKTVKYLGTEFKLASRKTTELPVAPGKTKVISLTPDLLIGVPHNSKIKDETRRFDESDYEYVPLTKENYREMMDNGINVFRVNAEQAKWIETENVYYWGIGGKDVQYPECLYTSNYIGPAIFFDEPMVHTRDRVLKPLIKEDPDFAKTLTPEVVFEKFKHEFHKAKYEGYPTMLIKGLSARDDVNTGDMDFLQQNIYSWETMTASAVYQLSEGNDDPPYAMVFEPPGRFGSVRVLPELNMSFDCQIPADDPKNMIEMITGFLRGAARVTDKQWGISIYGQVIPTEAFWYMTHAYDLGATLFFYWDSYQLAAVPYDEYLALSKNLREHSRNFPRNNIDKLKERAKTAILLPPGYNLGHVKMGIGNISGLPALNMEQKNSYGIKYRDMMSNFYVEIERCIRLGISYDLFWNLDSLNLTGYDEVVEIREDGKVKITRNGESTVLDAARTPERPAGIPPHLSVEVKAADGNKAGSYTATATVSAGSAPVYYTQGANKEGIYRNTYVLWELYGPEEEDYTDYWNERWNVIVKENNDTATVKLKFNIDKPGKYRMKVSAADLAGRSSVVWKEIDTED